MKTKHWIKDSWVFLFLPTRLTIYKTNFYLTRWLVFAKVRKVRTNNKWRIVDWL